jgi:hypothetical protein
MNATWIAVIGTLGGVALTALATLLSARLTVSSQRSAAAAQRLHEARNKLRDERRATFVSYLAAYQALYSRAVEKIETSPSSAEIDRFGDDERDAFSRAYQELLITAELPETTEAARAATAALWDLVRAVHSDLTEFREAEERAQGPRRRLRAEMREELNPSRR